MLSLPRTVTYRMPEHGVGAPARDEQAWISSLRSSRLRLMEAACGNGAVFAI